MSISTRPQYAPPPRITVLNLRSGIGSHREFAVRSSAKDAIDTIHALLETQHDLLDALKTIAANAPSVQMDPQWAVDIAKKAVAKATGSAA